MTRFSRDHLIYGVALNDAGYTVTDCPYHKRWRHMIERCYSEYYPKSNPSYIGCSVCPEWLRFSNFKEWMQKQEWQGLSLDKDLLFVGNKVYSPENCVFITQEVNVFIFTGRMNNSDTTLPLGVRRSGKNKYRAQCRIDGKNRNLGTYDTAEQAASVWLKNKLERAAELASMQSDPRIAKAIIERFENYEGKEND